MKNKVDQMKTYDAYKDIGVQWIGEIPSRWDTNKLKYMSKVSPRNVDKKIYSEQEQIVAYLDAETQKIDSIIFNEEQRIGLLKEYKQLLISEVVTGKRKVI